MPMVDVELAAPASYTAWRDAARTLLSQNIAPADVCFRLEGESGDLFAQPLEHSPSAARPASVPRAFVPLAELAICHNDTARFALLYRLLWRLQRSAGLLNDATDDDVWLVRRMAKSVRRDAHKMKAFVRFRQVQDSAGEAFVAWFEPEHHVVELTAPFFMKRFTGMRWSIVTPTCSAHWDTRTLRLGRGATRADCPDFDTLEDWWRTYYASIFNPARLKVKAMGAEMPKKYWRNLPESRLIGDLVRDAQKAQRAAPAGTRPSMSKARHLVARQRGTAPLAGPLSTAQQLAMDIARCERCTLHQCATQAVPGIGPDQARLVLVGEQPGDQEDLVGKPFVGPAGQTLDRALHAAGIDRKAIYLTNAVKHFKYEVRGRRRLHSRPNAAEIEHCRWWLGQELALIKPQVTVALGATAARALLGRPCRVQDLRGQVLHDDDGRALLVTVHPAYLLRLGNAARAATEFERFVADLDAARTLAASAAGSVL